jgi:hypothetical protein
MKKGDWVIEKATGRVGILKNLSWCEAGIRFGRSAAAIRYPDEIELAPLDIREEDILAMQHIAVEMNDKTWFEELGQRLIVEVR